MLLTKKKFQKLLKNIQSRRRFKDKNLSTNSTKHVRTHRRNPRHINIRNISTKRPHNILSGGGLFNTKKPNYENDLKELTISTTKLVLPEPYSSFIGNDKSSSSI